MVGIVAALLAEHHALVGHEFVRAVGYLPAYINASIPWQINWPMITGEISI